MYIEVITTNILDSKEAEKLNIDRIELVENLEVGGLTPNMDIISSVCNSIDIPVNVMLRSQANSFIYSDEDMSLMLKDLEKIKKTKANGIVFGCLDKNGDIDEEKLKIIIDKKEHLDLTFHRAIDETQDYFKALKILTKYDIKTILTSGHHKSALDGKDNLIKAKNILLGSNIQLLAGAGLKESNIFEFIKNTKISDLHLGSGARLNNVFENDFNKDFLKKLKS